MTSRRAEECLLAINGRDIREFADADNALRLDVDDTVQIDALSSEPTSVTKISVDLPIGPSIPVKTLRHQPGQRFTESLRHRRHQRHRRRLVSHRGSQRPVRGVVLGRGLRPVAVDHGDRRRRSGGAGGRHRTAGRDDLARSARSLVDRLGCCGRTPRRHRVVRARPAVQHRGVHTGRARGVPRWWCGRRRWGYCRGQARPVRQEPAAGVPEAVPSTAIATGATLAVRRRRYRRRRRLRRRRYPAVGTSAVRLARASPSPPAPGSQCHRRRDTPPSQPVTLNRPVGPNRAAPTPRDRVEWPDLPADPPRRAYARIECDETVIAEAAFDLTVGLSPTPVIGVVGPALVRPPSSVGDYELTAHVVADGFELAPGETWRKTMMVTAAEPYPFVEFHLVAPPASDEQQVHEINVLYSVDSQTMGLGIRPVRVVGSLAELERRLPAAAAGRRRITGRACRRPSRRTSPSASCAAAKPAD